MLRSEDNVVNWIAEFKLFLSKSKTHMILLKGSMVSRSPLVRLEGTPIALSEAVKYLGVVYGPRLNVHKHLELVGGKCKKIFNLLCSLAGGTWGLKFLILNTLYKGIFLAVTTYAYSSWEDLLKKRLIKTLLSIQRQALLRVTKACHS